ncbi:hypothetical protein PQ455_13385 [Sphingomonas naphthae]|uniref:DUF4166 domain-containing protein n=1 Tax=Sphingomonas naphthae TaxID=1813468 RepID=A0ABY7THI0_9SPHN|nr:hypothetical protein [Sphingomonas naphthae]WCT72620.1 hypothetical protein PQ455_13385 [Sphingomonas naphthae]
MSALQVAIEASRVLLFRRYLQASIRWAPPILIDAVLPAVLIRALYLLRPEDPWPMMPMPVGYTDPLMGTRKGYNNIPSRRARRFIDRFVRYGVIIRQPTDPAGGLALRVAGEDLEVGLTFGRSLMSTRRGVLRIEIPRGLPETLQLGAVGRRIHEVIGHELLDGRDYPVTRVTSTPAHTVFEVRVDRVAYEMPWADLVDGRN